MARFVDIHCHALFGVDDGASSEEVMQQMLRLAYETGTGTVCFTPHFDPYHKFDQVALERAFSSAVSYCADHCPEMRLVLGNELSYHMGCLESVLDGRCRTMAGGRYVLIDFFSCSGLPELQRCVTKVAGSGYIPIIAHVERYGFLSGKVREIAALREGGAVIQVNANSILLGCFSSVGRMARRLLAEDLVDIVASDGHDASARSPVLCDAYRAVQKKYGEAYADQLFSTNPERVLSGKRI